MTQINAVKKKGHPKFNVPNYGARGRSRARKDGGSSAALTTRSA